MVVPLVCVGEGENIGLEMQCGAPKKFENICAPKTRHDFLYFAMIFSNTPWTTYFFRNDMESWTPRSILSREDQGLWWTVRCPEPNMAIEVATASKTANGPANAPSGHKELLRLGNGTFPANYDQNVSHRVCNPHNNLRPKSHVFT